MSPDQDKVLTASREVWQAVLGLDLAIREAAIDPDEDLFGSYVHITGDWNVTVLLESAQSVTLHAAAVLFEIDAESVSRQDLQDAHNELVRLLARKLRAVHAESDKVSAPKTAAEGVETAALSRMRAASGLDLSCEGRPIRISILEQVEAPAEA